MKRKKEDYRGIIELLELTPKLRQLIGLSQLPHFTTINKFFLRTNTSAIYNALVQSVSLFTNDKCILSIDSTGYSASYASRHYLWRIGLGSYTRRKHIKLSISVNTDNQCIIAAKPRLSPRNDNIDFPMLARQSASLANPAYIVADKGYDSEANHVLADQLGSHAVIPLKVREGCRTGGRFRRRMIKEFNEQVYHRRSIVETVNSVMKRLMGSWVRSRSLAHQCKEAIGMCVVYNVHRSIKVLLFYGWFLQSQLSLSFLNPFYEMSVSKYSRLIPVLNGTI